MIVVTAVEEWRSDFAMMMVHHFVTVFLVSTSYMMNYVRIGLLILVLHDAADPLLPLAKALRYLRLNPLDDLAFAAFAVAWIPTRHFLMPSIVVSITEVSPRVMSCGKSLYEVVIAGEGCPGKWDYAEGYYWNGEVMIPLYLLVIGVLQLLCVLWLFDIGKGVWAFVVYGEADDHRSDEEDEEWEPKKKQT